jgi:hypothetical protein
MVGRAVGNVAVGLKGVGTAGAFAGAYPGVRPLVGVQLTDRHAQLLGIGVVRNRLPVELGSVPWETSEANLLVGLL